MKISLARILFVLALLVAWGRPAHSATFTDDLSAYPKNVCFADGSTVGPWSVMFSGYGCIKIVASGGVNWFDETPFASVAAAETHASLILAPTFTNPMTLSVNMNTVAQLRKNTPTNPWEVGWVFWHYSDNTHFYYFQIKPNGWELGKEDPAYPGAQRFLATGITPIFPIGKTYAIKVSVDAQNVTTIYVDNAIITTFTDAERPYSSGKIGLYSEDAHVQFAKITVTDAGTPTVTPPPTAVWKNIAFAPQGTPFEAKFDAVPSTAKMDGSIGLSKGAAAAYTSLAAIVRFNNIGTIDARNGGAYATAASIPYTPGKSYRFRLDVDMAKHTYSAYVAPSGAAEVLIGANYAFRTEQATTASLSSLGSYASVGGVSVANLTVAPWTPTAAPTPVPAVGNLDAFGVNKIFATTAGGKEWMSKWGNGAARTFGYADDPGDAWFHGKGNATYSIDGKGQLSVSGAVPRMYISDPALLQSWRNVEMTVYAYRVVDQGTAWGGIEGVARTNHGSTGPEATNLCDTRGNDARFRYDGHIDFEKETSHPNSVAVQNKTFWPAGFPFGQWIGYKLAVYDLANGNVKLENYMDLTDGANGGTWVKVNELEDNGTNFGVGGVPCKTGVNPALKLLNSDVRAGSESGKPNIAVYWRTDNVGTNGMIYKKMSVREINPANTAL
jgi:hypothetical protein